MKVSVVTISYNQGLFLERTIRSVLDQTYPDVEYIVVDPGSSDGSRDIIERYRGDIAHAVLEPDAGPADGLNKGFAVATGDVFLYLNADDTITPDAVATAVAAFRSDPEADVVYGHAWVTDRDDRRLRRVWSDPFDRRAAAFGESILIQPSTYLRAEMFRQVGGFDIRNRVSWDAELWVDVALAGARFRRIDAFLSTYRLHGDSVTASGRLDELRAENGRRIFAKVFGRPPASRDRLAARWYWARRKALNPLDAIERLRRGRVHNRVLDR